MNVWGYSAIAFAGLLTLVCGFILNQFFPKYMKSQLEEKLILRPDSPTIDNFISAPIPIYLEFNFFNVTNSEDVLKGERPKVTEVGPYVYEQKKVKHDLNWTDTTVEYLETTRYTFRRNLSGGSEEDMITTLNPVLISMAAKIDSHDFPDAIYGLFEVFKLRFKMETFMTKKVGELLFKGYQEDILLEVSKFTNDPIHKTGKFGFFHTKNNTNGGAYSIFTGEDGLEKLQVIHKWKNQTSLDFWDDEYCNMINGTGGGQFPQPILPERISLFSADLCRSLYLTYESQRNFGGLTLYRYSLPTEVLSDRPENRCYCTDDFTCKSSMMNLAPCRKGAPVIASTPHFYMGEEDLVDTVEGLYPTKELHETYLDIEPNTGVTFKAMKRLQMSMPLRRYAQLPELLNVQEVILPIFWINERAEVPLDRAEDLHYRLTTPQFVVDVVTGFAFLTGLILLVIPIISFVKSKKGCRASHVVTTDEVKEEAVEEEPLKSGQIELTEIHPRD